jgi:predicted ATP-dependent endonuclease of OLD family
MRIDFVEIANFRKLLSTRVGFAPEKTIFVGANNSGKTSAMVALRTFLVGRERHNLTLTDITLSHWTAINAMGKSWEEAREKQEPLPASSWDAFLPFIDLWLHVEDDEVHYVQKILPTLDWEAGRLGIRLRLQPKDTTAIQNEYLAAREDTRVLMQGDGQQDGDVKSTLGLEGDELIVALWPQTLNEFLKRRLGRLFEIKGYVLDPAKLQEPEHGRARPQVLGADIDPVDGDPLKGLVRIDEISAQRGFSEGDAASDDDDDDDAMPGARRTRKLTDQLRRYYKRHLDPYEKPEAQDLQALRAIEIAQKAFDKRLTEGFDAALKEMETLGYPGITNPRLNISTRLRPVEGLNHEAAVQYLIPYKAGEQALDMLLPEDSNGLGYQNLISMVFRLMSFRDAWMRVGKAQTRTMEGAETFTPPLHLVLVEEPEAYLHAQVQQAFIRRAYDVLRNHPELKKKDTRLTTQLAVSTHSSHVAHECDFASLRYFRRLPARDSEVPTACVASLTTVFGEETDTKRFVTRYLKVTHCDLFFADAAVFIEGPAERILVPHFVRYQPELRDLSECYITWLEIGGSHAHRLKELIEKLGLTTLVITDLDAVGEDRKKVAPARGKNLKSRNATLKSWVPAAENLDDLLDKSADSKVKRYEAERFSVRAAYQDPVKIVFKGVECEALANTLEDAVVFQNIDLFSQLEGPGLIAKFRAAIAESKTFDELAARITESLKDGDKAELAMGLLELENPKALKPPTYIRDGLLWLADQLGREQRDLGLPVRVVPKLKPAQEAAE